MAWTATIFFYLFRDCELHQQIIFHCVPFHVLFCKLFFETVTWTSDCGLSPWSFIMLAMMPELRRNSRICTKEKRSIVFRRIHNSIRWMKHFSKHKRILKTEHCRLISPLRKRFLSNAQQTTSTTSSEVLRSIKSKFGECGQNVSQNLAEIWRNAANFSKFRWKNSKHFDNKCVLNRAKIFTLERC